MKEEEGKVHDHSHQSSHRGHGLVSPGHRDQRSAHRIRRRIHHHPKKAIEPVIIRNIIVLVITIIAVFKN